MNNALSIVSQFYLTKSQIATFADKALEEIDSGLYNPLQIHLCLKGMEELIKVLKEGMAEQVIAEAEKHGKQFDFMGASVKLSERKTYDFSQDSTWCEMDKAKKEREEMMKHITSPMADADTGEMIYPAQFKITSIISVTLPQ